MRDERHNERSLGHRDKGGRRALGRTATVVLLGLAGCSGQSMDEMMRTISPPSPGEAARMAVNPYDPDDRREGTTLLANAPFGGDDVYVRMYRDYVEHDPDPLVKAAAIRGLARYGEPEDALLIAAHLEDESPVVRREAAQGLQRLHDPAVVPDMLERLADPAEEAGVRVALARGLAQYPEDRVFQGLLGALDARELSVNLAASESLETLTGHELGLDARAWLAWYDEFEEKPRIFDGRQEYFYPTYRRKVGWMERLAFWDPKVFEQPGLPAGKRPEGTRTTYDEEEGDEGPRSTYGDEGEGER